MINKPHQSLDDIIEATYSTVTTGRQSLKDIWLETPVSFETFATSQQHMAFPPLSPLQLQAVQAILGLEPTKIFEEAPHHVLVALVGKGGGKDSLAALINAYMVYALLCLRNPQAYLHHGISGEPIDILNIAVSETQAKNVYFEKFKQRIVNWKWLKSKKWKIVNKSKQEMDPTDWRATGQSSIVVTGNGIIFPGNIRAFSGHSRSASMEGLNPLSSVLDEYARFRDANKVSNANTLYQMCESSGKTRFAKAWRMFLLSYPEHDGDAMMQKYDEAMQEMERKPIPPRTLYGLRAATWEFNPTVSREDFADDYEKDPRESARLYECVPPKQLDPFFDLGERIDPCEQDRPNAVETAAEYFTAPTGMRTAGQRITRVLIPRKPDRIVHMAHIDLAETHDTAGVAIGHLEPDGVVALDFLGEWHPDRKQRVPIDHDNIIDLVMQMKDRCFNIGAVSFDQHQSFSHIQRLNKRGMHSYRLSVGLEHYKHAKTQMYARKVTWPRHAGLRKAVDKLRQDGNALIKDPTASKDLLDAVVGVIYNLTGMSKPNQDSLKNNVPIGEREPLSEYETSSDETFDGGMGFSLKL